jgi:predicted kinase
MMSTLSASDGSQPARPEPAEIPFDLPTAVAAVEKVMHLPLETTAHPVLIVLCGLPGTGKSYLSRQLSTRLPAVVMETDFVRKTLFPAPTYTFEESKRVHRVAQALIVRYLRQGRHVISDATNLREFHREMLYHLADVAGAGLVVVRVVASQEVVRERLELRQVTRAEGDISDADFSIYQRMRRDEEPIRRPHLVVDTSQDLEEGLAKILRAVRRG